MEDLSARSKSIFKSKLFSLTSSIPDPKSGNKPFKKAVINPAKKGFKNYLIWH